MDKSFSRTNKTSFVIVEGLPSPNNAALAPGKGIIGKFNYDYLPNNELLTAIIVRRKAMLRRTTITSSRFTLYRLKRATIVDRHFTIGAGAA